MTPHKGHDVLLDALETVADLSWCCTCVGSLDRDPVFAATVRRRATRRDRVEFTGPRTGSELDRTYAAADLLVLPSYAETYGMVITEALARGVPVIATDVGGVSEALGRDGPGCSSLRATRRPSARRCDAGSATPTCADACAEPPGNGARSLRPWAATASVAVSRGVLAGAAR